MKKAFLLALIIALSASALFAAYIFLVGGLGANDISILLTALAVGGYSLMGFCCATLYERGRYRALPSFGIAFSALGFVWSLALIWEWFLLLGFNDSGASFALQVLVTLIILSFSSAHLSLLFLVESSRSPVRIIFGLTFALIALLTALSLYVTWNIGSYMGFERIIPIMGATAILDVLGTIVTPLLKKVFPDVIAPAPLV